MGKRKDGVRVGVGTLPGEWESEDGGGAYMPSYSARFGASARV